MSSPGPEEMATLLAMLAHDLRNPLAALLTNINFVRTARLAHGREVEAALSDAALSCAVLTQLIGNIDVLSVAMVEAEPFRRPLNVRQIAHEAVARFSVTAELLGVRLELVVAPPPATVSVDPVFIARAMDNLLANALQFSPPGSTVSITCTNERSSAMILVSDDGPIVPESLRAQVLTAPGQVAAKSRLEARYGRGLGLYCAAEAARAASAELAITERDGRAAFVLSAPCIVPLD
jgi:K+-sensing histidine kinase KdpD